MPLFDNGDVFYLSTNQMLLNRLDVLQNRALRTIFRMDPRENTGRVMEKLNIMPLKQRRTLHLMQLIRWVKETGALVDDRALPTRAHSMNICNLIVRRPRISLYQRSFLHRGCRAWNALPPDVQTECEENVFKNCIKDLLSRSKQNCNTL